MAVIADFKSKGGLWRKYKRTPGKLHTTISGRKWQDMMARCSDCGNESYATYSGTEVSDNFKDFQFFTEWHQGQVGYGMNYHLDKDLLGGGVYSEDNCVLLPPALNLFIRGSVARKGDLPQGVSFCTRRLKYVAGISHGNKSVYAGRHDTIEGARQAYCVVKDRLAKEWYERLCEGEFLVDNRVVLAMREWDTNARYS